MRKPAWHVLDAGIFITSLAIVWLGIAVAAERSTGAERASL